MSKAKPKTRTVEYVGDHGPVFVPRDGDTDLVFAPGEPVEVDADLADRLLEQNTFAERGGSGGS